jgi:hypothetical protein
MEMDNTTFQHSIETSVLDAKVKALISKYEEYSDKEISDIIAKYSEYQPDAVEAALFISVNRGIITSDERDKLLEEIDKHVRRNHKKKVAVVAANRKFGHFAMITGLILLAAGILLTILSVNNPVGGQKFIFYGMIAGGIVLFFRGLFY